MKAKKLFARVSSGRAICEDDFQGEIVCAKLFHATDTFQTLPVRLKALTEFCVAPFPFSWQWCEGL